MSPSDYETINRKVGRICEDLARLEKEKNLSLEEYLTDYDKQLIIERLLEKIVGRILDINYHILSKEFKILPDDYGKSFEKLGRNMNIDVSFIDEIKKSAGTRNALVHEYDDLDLTRVYSAFQKSLTQVPKYLDLILKRLDERK